MPAVVVKSRAGRVSALRLIAVTLTLGVVAWTATSRALAQAPTRGQILVGGFGPLQDARIAAVDYTTNAVTTLFALPGFAHVVQSVTMAEDNVSWVFSVYDFTRDDGWIGRMRTPGVWTTLFRFGVGDGPQSHATDVDGSVLVATRTGDLLDIDGSGRATTLYRGTALINAVATEPISGFPVWGEFGSPGRVRIFDRILGTPVRGPAVAFIRSICLDQRGGGLLIGTAVSPPILRWGGSQLTTFTTLTVGDAVTPLDDGTFVAAGSGGSRPTLVRFDGSGGPLTTIDLSAVFATVRSLAAYGARSLSGNSALLPGQSMGLRLQSPTPTDARLPYLILPSLSTLPGFAITPTKYIGVNLDGLTQLTLAGQLPGAPGFIGALDGQGRAQASLFLPRPLRGVRIYLAGVVFDASRPWPATVRTVTNTLAITLP